MTGEVVSPRGREVGWLRAAGTVASLLLLAWILGRQDWLAIVRHAGAVPPGLLAAALAMFLASQAGGAARWWILLRYQRIGIGYGRAFRINAAGLFASNFLPGTIGGDVLRVAGILPLTVGPVIGLASVVADRLIGIATMVLVLPLSWLAFGPRLMPALGGLLGVGVPSDRISKLARMASDRVRAALAPWLARPQSLIFSMLASIAAVAIYLSGLWTVARGLGIEVTLAQVAGVTGITYFLSQIPISVNGLGIREAAMIALYVPLGATGEQAAALALITRLLVMLSSLHGALWAPSLLSAARAAPTEAIE